MTNSNGAAERKQRFAIACLIGVILMAALGVILTLGVTLAQPQKDNSGLITMIWVSGILPTTAALLAFLKAAQGTEAAQKNSEAVTDVRGLVDGQWSNQAALMLEVRAELAQTKEELAGLRGMVAGARESQTAGLILPAPSPIPVPVQQMEIVGPVEIAVPDLVPRPDPAVVPTPVTVVDPAVPVKIIVEEKP